MCLVVYIVVSIYPYILLYSLEKLIICMRYGLDGYSPSRQREVAAVTGISRSYVSRIEKRALGKLRQALE